MTSILTNSSAMAALQTLRSINSNLADTQSRVSSGLRVATAADNAAYWSIATTMQSDNKAISAASDALGVGQAILDATYAGLEQILVHVSEIKALMVQAMGASQSTTWANGKLTGDIGKIAQAVDQHAIGIVDAAKSSSFAGVNLLINEDGSSLGNDSVSIVSGYTRNSILTTDIKLKEIVLYNKSFMSSGEAGIFDALVDYEYASGMSIQVGISRTNSQVGYDESDEIEYIGPDIVTQIESYLPLNPAYAREDFYNAAIDGIDDYINNLADAMATVGATQKSLEMSASFLEKQMDAIDSGISRLVDSDMEEAATRLKALQTQEQLAIQSLQIANSAPEAVLRLFQ